MNFAGYVPLNRGLIEHTRDGRLSNNEALVFVWLVMLADRKTGSYTINGPTLRSFLPGLSKGAAQDALEGLQRKRYIYRDVKARSAVAYRYWINGFAPTDGPNKTFRLDLTEVFENRDSSRLRWVKPPDYTNTYSFERTASAPETTPATQLGTPPATQPGTPNYNKNEKEIEIEIETPLGDMRGERKRCMEGEAERHSQSEPIGEREVSERCGESDRESCIQAGNPPELADSLTALGITTTRDKFPWRDAIVRLTNAGHPIPSIEQALDLFIREQGTEAAKAAGVIGFERNFTRWLLPRKETT